MFPFASLLHGVPLFIMAIGYVIWFGVYTLNRSQESGCEANEAKKELIVSAACTVQEDVLHLNLWNTGESEDQAEASSGSGSIKVFRSVTGVIRPPEDNRPSLSLCLSGLFCRPPPL